MPHRSAPLILLLGAARDRSELIQRRLDERGIPADLFDLRQRACEDVLRLADVAAFVLDERTQKSELCRVSDLLTRLRSHHIASLVWGAPSDAALPDGELVEKLALDTSIDEVVGHISVLAHVAPQVRRLETELDQLRRLGQHVQRYFEEIDKEMRLAGRLQREFLPHDLPHAPNLRFAALYRPAGWVSGDIYDVFTIDERRRGVFVGDAMGHGTAAALMAMFLRTSLTPVEQLNGKARVLDPAEALGALHESLAKQNLRKAQFVTAAYATIDSRTLELRVARGGHPYPILARADGALEELRCDGGLLGVADLPPEFHGLSARLEPGDKMIIYTDGLEDLFVAERDRQTGAATFADPLRQWQGLCADEIIDRMHAFLDARDGSLNPDDDATVVIAEATAAGASS